MILHRRRFDLYLAAYSTIAETPRSGSETSKNTNGSNLWGLLRDQIRTHEREMLAKLSNKQKGYIFFRIQYD